MLTLSPTQPPETPSEPQISQDAARQMLAALRRAKRFIENGVELGFIRMPDRSTPDSAHETLPAITAALASVEQSP